MNMLGLGYFYIQVRRKYILLRYKYVASHLIILHWA